MGEMTKTSVKYCRKCKYAYKHNQTEVMCGYYLQTNADRIRSMTDEELAEVLFGSCIEHIGVEECSHPEEACKSCVLDWLRAESEE